MKGLKKTIEEKEKLSKKLQPFRKKCKCGHVVILIEKPFMICSHCGNPIFKDEKAKFKYKLGGIRCFYS